MVGTTVYQGEQARKAQNKAADAAQKQAEETAKKADEAYNAANQKAPDLTAIMAKNKQAGAGGVSSTMLTGPSGTSPNAALLGKSTLLGQ
jgi:hypothetical protein